MAAAAAAGYLGGMNNAPRLQAAALQHHPAAQAERPSPTRQLVHDLDNSPRQVAQRRQLEASFGRAAMGGGAPAGPAAQRAVYQLQTRLYYAPPNNRDGNSVIGATSHNRNLHNNTQRDLAAYHSGYVNSVHAATRGANICNHHVSYTAIARAVRDAFAVNTPNHTLSEAVGWVGTDYNPNHRGARNFHNGSFGFQFGALPDADINDVGAGMAEEYDEFEVETELDDVIFNLANDPQNLFYWPTKTGGDPDKPTNGSNSDMHGNNVTRQDLRTRLEDYRDHLANDIGLNVP
ncbi:hypothetical protein [Rhizobacter sp. SG703]|uniref:hypothetical protein n=1 Tax=Rhizobacter sp. SG703 TaxID=2587140 RepID=UPI0014470399|nr:hypothetical protein [Rhizobacter sp. SG703]NKI97132.1 hypothetical protein [Rhizobacter sp. SG703]